MWCATNCANRPRFLFNFLGFWLVGSLRSLPSFFSILNRKAESLPIAHAFLKNSFAKNFTTLRFLFSASLFLCNLGSRPLSYEFFGWLKCDINLPIPLRIFTNAFELFCLSTDTNLSEEFLIIVLGSTLGGSILIVLIAVPIVETGLFEIPKIFPMQDSS